MELSHLRLLAVGMELSHPGCRLGQLTYFRQAATAELFCSNHADSGALSQLSKPLRHRCLFACRYAAAEARRQAEVTAHAATEQQLRSAVGRLQTLAQQGQPQAVSQTPSDGRLQAAQARCDRAEGHSIAQQGKTQQVMLVFCASTKCDSAA